MEDRHVTYTGVAATGAAIFAALALAKKASAGTGVIPPEIIELLTAMAADISDMDINLLPQIIAALSAGGNSGKGYAPNLDYPYTGRYQFPDLLPIQLPNVAIEDDYRLLIKAFNGNPGGTYIYVGHTGPDVVNPNASWPLAGGETVSYRVKNAQEIFVASSVGPGTWSTGR